MRVNFKDKTIAFKKDSKIHNLTFSTVPGDELCPCVLFYYLNDEVEFLPHHKF